MSVGYTIILRRIPTRYSSLSIVFYVQLVALVLFYAVWGVFDRQSLQDTIAPLSADLSPVIAVGYLAVFASVTAFILFCYTVRQIGVTRANVFNNVRPVFTALLMWVIFDEQLPIWKWVGIIVIVIGLFISQKQRKIE
jgi:drug/metabolite transporter (DMT)-like permease